MNASLDMLCEAPALAPHDNTDSTAPAAANDESTPESRLIDWLKAHGAEFDPLALADIDGLRGVRATADIARSQIVARIPQKMFITADVAKASRIGGRLAAHSDALDDRTYLTAYLLEVRRDGGFWKPYVDTLPCDFTGHLMLAGPLELMALDPLSSLSVHVKIARDGRRATYESIAPVLAVEGFSAADFDWAYCCVRSRCYNTAPTGEPIRPALIPFTDMLNHVNDPATHGRRDPSGDYLVTATRDVAAGAEVTASYGDHGNAALASVYGFHLEKNRYDVAHLTIDGKTSVVTLRYDDEASRKMFQWLRRSIPVALAETASTDGSAPCSIHHEFACLDAIHRACEVAISRSYSVLDTGAEDLLATLDPSSPAGMLLALIKAESWVLCHWDMLAMTGGRVLRDRGTNAQDRALLTNLSPEYAAEVFQLIDRQGGTHEQ